MRPAPTRRVVTGHTSQGKAVFDRDSRAVAVNPATKQPPTNDSTPAITLIHRTTGHPETLRRPDDELEAGNLQRSKGDSIVCQVVDIPPSSQGQSVDAHRNQSLDYGVVLASSLILELDDGQETILEEGDVYVQRGTMHSWRNASDTQFCRFLTVVIPSERIKVEEMGVYLETTKLKGLTDEEMPTVNSE